MTSYLVHNLQLTLRAQGHARFHPLTDAQLRHACEAVVLKQMMEVGDREQGAGSDPLVTGEMILNVRRLSMVAIAIAVVVVTVSRDRQVLS